MSWTWGAGTFERVGTRNVRIPMTQSCKVTMHAALAVRAWVEAILGLPAALVIERIGERNRVVLRIENLGECEVATLLVSQKSLRRLVPENARAQLAEAFRCIVV